MKHFLISLMVLCTIRASKAQTTEKVLLKEDYVVTISTSHGDMIALLYEQTPLHKKNFIKLVQEHYYDSTTFHRVIREFMIQGGDPNSKDPDSTNDGYGNPGYTIPAEINAALSHEKGALAAARMGDANNPQRASNGSQFYIVQSKKGTSTLNGAYTVFGQVISGSDVIDKIAQVPVDKGNRPFRDVRMKVTAVKMKTKKIIKLYDCAWFYNM